MKDIVPSKVDTSKKEAVISYVDKISSYLQALKARDIISAEIFRNTKEKEYINGRLAMELKRLRKVKQSINDINSRLDGPRKDLARFESEKQNAEDGYNELEAKLKEIERNLGILRKKNLEIALLNEDISDLSEKLYVLESEYRQELALKDMIEKDFDSFKSNIRPVKVEGALITDTKDIISSMGRELIVSNDIITTDDKDAKARLNLYFSELKQNIENILLEITTIRANLTNAREEEEYLYSQLDVIQKKVKELEFQITVDKNKEELMSEMAPLENRRHLLAADHEANSEELERLKSEINEVGNNLELERTVERDTRKSLDYLKLRKQEIDELEDPLFEFERLENEINTLIIETTGNNNHLDITKKVIEQAASIKSLLKSAFEDYKELLNELESLLAH